ncbi:hypothetical protein HUZ36_05285 [Pseudoalteromonas sp. McH1-7]|uniref:hypothetical protein n=1 Tax=Pseudoalteromonas sp. McH1-7 TaxID=2745574 RepID=UPI00159067A2|nr:hypothetical protein [Pseudoalteromonas sp. McH1-7]NUZ10188.1 hypothetical protein [Pseudoalteromonas sp. McH1-7]
MDKAQQYYEHLKAAGVALHDFNCPHCKAQLRTQQNNTKYNWDTLSTCNHCNQVFWKVTFAEGHGVHAEAKRA